MNYYLDTEFLEGPQKKWPWGKTKPTIDLISIGIAEEDTPAFSKRIGKTERVYAGREYYAISKDFNLKEAWNRYDLDYGSGDQRNKPPRKVYWIREHVLKPIFKELWYEKCHLQNLHHCTNDFTYKNLKRLINLYGKTNKQIAKEIKAFVYYTGWECDPPVHEYHVKEKGEINFFTYYGDYDWVVFCWLFGRMIDLPKGFPMYSKDLKQELDRKIQIKSNRMFGNIDAEGRTEIFKAKEKYSFNERLDIIKSLARYPKQENEHNALDDARWNKKLHKFLKNL